MSNETENKSTIPARSVTRNGISKVMSIATFGKKSNNAGKQFPLPVTSVADFDKEKDWYGLDFIVGVANKASRLIFAEIFLDEDYQKELEATGTYPWDKWQADAEDFTAGVAKLSSLMEDLDDLVADQQQMALDPNFIIEDGVEPSAEYLAIVEGMKGIARKIKPIREQIAGIKAKYAARIEAKEAKKKTAEATAKAA